MIKELLKKDYTLLKKQKNWLEVSYLECLKIGIKNDYSIDEFGKFETLCSRYSRSIDFLIRKVFRTIDTYEFENQGSLIDVVNNAHKRGIIDDIDKLRIMKDVRNTIVHEYIEDELIEVFDEVLNYTKELLLIIDTTLNYIEKLQKVKNER